MKRVFALALCLLMLVGCGETTEEAWGTVMTVTDVTPTGLSLSLSAPAVNPQTGYLQTGRAYSLERLTNDTWSAVPTLHEPIFTTEGIGVPMSDTINWEWLYGTLPKGHYRLKKEIMLYRAPGDFDKATVTAEFDIN